MYCQFMNTTEEKLREDARPNALVSLRVQAAIELIVELEGLTPTDGEMNMAMVQIARQNRLTLEQLEEYADEAFRAAVVRSVLTSKAMRLVRDCAEIETV